MDCPLHFQSKPQKQNSAGQNVFSSSCFTKQKCQLQMGIEQYENAGQPLRTQGNNNTHQHFQMRFVTFLLLKRLKSYQELKF